MDYSELKQRAKEEEWWSEECPARWQYCYWAHSFVEQRAYFHPDFLSLCAVTIQNEFGQEKTSVQEKLATYDWIKAQYQSDRGFFDREYERWVVVRDAVDELDSRIVQLADTWSVDELRENYNKLIPLAIDSTRWGVVIEATDPYSERILPKKLVELFPELSDEERNDINITLSSPLIVSFMEEFELAKLQIIAEFRDSIEAANTWDDVDRASELGMRIDELRLSYQWLSVNYAGSDPLSCTDLFVQIHEDAHNRSAEQITEAIADVESKVERTQQHQEEILSKYELSFDLLDDYSIMREIGRWMDERKETMVRTNLALWAILGAIAEKTGVPKQVVEWYTSDEIDALLGSSVRVDESQIMERQTNAVFVTEYDGDNGSTLTIYTGDQATEVYGLFNPENTEALQGMVAARSKDGVERFAGKAQVILDSASHSFEAGNILVTSMTRPDFVPLLKKAAAIITDEGGVTCHAAVVSRELGIPCIIGTKYATKKIADGEQVEMDLTTGEIRSV